MANVTPGGKPARLLTTVDLALRSRSAEVQLMAVMSHGPTLSDSRPRLCTAGRCSRVAWIAPRTIVSAQRSTRRVTLLTLAVSSRGERRRASGLLDCDVMRLRKTTHQFFDIGWHLAPPHDTRPQLKKRSGGEGVRQSNSREVVMQIRPPSAMQRIARGTNPGAAHLPRAHPAKVVASLVCQGTRLRRGYGSGADP